MLFEQDALYYEKQIKNKEVSVTDLAERVLANIEKYNANLKVLEDPKGIFEVGEDLLKSLVKILKKITPLRMKLSTTSHVS